MLSAQRSGEPAGAGAFSHEAFFYSSDDDYAAGIVPFITDGLENGEEVLVVVGPQKIDLLRVGLGEDADHVRFADMARVGRNPARIIPEWQRFVDEQTARGRRVRGVGEPITADRSQAELGECHQHESLLNVAFEGGVPWALLCPYDTEHLDPTTVAEARRTHPLVTDGSRSWRSDRYDAARGIHPFRRPLPTPPETVDRRGELGFGPGSLHDVREFVAHFALAAGLDGERISDLVLAINEIATNSVQHGGGRGMLRMWQDGGTVVCEVQDDGRLHNDPLLGRVHPSVEGSSGRGLWLANQTCDLVQLQSSGHGTAVRISMRQE